MELPEVSKDRDDIFFNDQSIQYFTVIFRNVGNHWSNVPASYPKGHEISRIPLPEPQLSLVLY
jgi:hypothetical protein